MDKPKKVPSYSFHVAWSQKDQEFVATFLELPGLSGLAPSVSNAIGELNVALDAWVAAIGEEELPEARFSYPVVILDRSFLSGREDLPDPLIVLPEELQPQGQESGNTSSNVESMPTRTIRISKTDRHIRI